VKITDGSDAEFDHRSKLLILFGVPDGIRSRVIAVKGADDDRNPIENKKHGWLPKCLLEPSGTLIEPKKLSSAVYVHLVFPARVSLGLFGFSGIKFPPVAAITIIVIANTIMIDRNAPHASGCRLVR
jgi:hypothetical protein